MGGAPVQRPEPWTRATLRASRWSPRAEWQAWTAVGVHDTGRSSAGEREQRRRTGQLQHAPCLATDAAQDRKLPTLTERLSLPDQKRHSTRGEKANVGQVHGGDRLSDARVASPVGRDGLRVDLTHQPQHMNAVPHIHRDATGARHREWNESRHNPMVGHAPRSSQHARPIQVGGPARPVASGHARASPGRSRVCGMPLRPILRRKAAEGRPRGS